MTDADYDRERAVLRETYGANKTEAGARFEQELARLFYRSGWTQEALAKKEGKSQRWVSYALLFGRFLDFSTSGANGPIPANLTERRFRSFWERTDKEEGNERIRFKQVLGLIESGELHAPRRRNITKELRDKFCDGKWHRMDAMARHFETDEAHVFEVIRGQRDRDKIAFDKKRVGKDGGGNGPTDAYRMFRTDKAVSIEELTTKLSPIVEDLEAEGRKNMATMSPATVATLAGRLKQLIDEWEK
jgi:hypothetical protein